MIIEPNDYRKDDANTTSGHVQDPSKIYYDDTREDRESLSEHNSIIEINSCIPTNEEIEDVYKANINLVGRTRANLLKKVLMKSDLRKKENDDLSCYNVLHTETDDLCGDIIERIEDTIREEHYKELSLIKSLRKHYENLHYEWLERKDNSHKLQPSSNENPDRPHPSKQLRRNFNIDPSTASGMTKPTNDRKFQNIGFRRRVTSDAVKTEAEFQAVLELLSGNIEDSTSNDDRIAIEPDLIIDPNELEILKYVNFNDYVPDFEKDFNRYNERIFSTWTEEEREIFYRKFLTYGKDFYKIAPFLPTKSVEACVHYYYREKIRLRLSRIARKSLKQRKRILCSRISLGKMNSDNSQVTSWSLAQ